MLEHDFARLTLPSSVPPAASLIFDIALVCRSCGSPGHSFAIPRQSHGGHPHDACVCLSKFVRVTKVKMHTNFESPSMQAKACVSTKPGNYAKLQTNPWPSCGP